MSTLTAADIVGNIKEDLGSGYRFLALVGAGLSVPSGFPQVTDLENRYLRYCVLRALGLNPLAVDESNIEEKRYSRWSPRSGDWPSMSVEVADAWSVEIAEARARRSKPQCRPLTREQMDKVLHWALAAVRDSNQRLPGLTEKIVAQAIGHVQEWRLALRFLSSLVRREEKSASHESGYPIEYRDSIELGLPDPAVTDSFFRYLLGGCEPSLGHRMLAALCPVLRINVIVSTNFDDMIERAFAAVPSPLAIFEVPQPAPLPAAQIVRNQRSLIKMNGGGFALRADSSIDQSAEPRDGDSFVGYCSGRPLYEGDSRPAFDKEKVAVIVSGVAGSERRTMGLLRRAREAFPQLHIYWIGFSGTAEDPCKNIGFGEKDAENFRFIAHKDHGLLFLQIYQACAQSVPPSGIPFPGLWQIPTPPLIPPPSAPFRTNAAFTKALPKIQEAIIRELDASYSHSKPAQPIVVRFAGGHRGAITICSRIFEEGLRSKTLHPHFLWIDLEQVARPSGVFLRIVQLAARQAGEFDPISALDYNAFDRPQNEGRFKSFCTALASVFRRYHARLGKPLLIFINAQEGAGTYAPFFLQKITDPAVHPSFEPRWTEPDATAKFVDLIGKLNNDSTCGIQFVLLTLTGLPQKKDRSIRSLRNKIISQTKWVHVPLLEKYTSFDERKTLHEALAWLTLNQRLNKKKVTLLFLLTLFRHARYPAGLVRMAARHAERFARSGEGGRPSRPLSVEELERIAESTSDWLEELEGKSVIRRQTGGLIWMHGALKTDLQKAITTLKKNDKAWPGLALYLEVLVARWYGRLLLSSADPLAAIESVYHALHAAWSYANSITMHPRILRKWEPLNVTIEHAHLVLNTARPLFGRRVSEQLVEAGLINLQNWANGTLKAFRAPALGCPESIIDALEILNWTIRYILSSTYLHEAEYHRVAKTFDDNPHPHTEAAQAISWKMRLHRAAALMFLRNYKPAGVELCEIWNEAAKLPNCSQQPCDFIEYFELRWERYPRGALAAQAWLLKESPLESERRFVIRLARWWSVWFLNEGQLALLYDKECGDKRQKQQAGNKRCIGLHRSLWFADFGLELLRAMPEVADCFVFEENVRFRVHAALCQSYLANLVSTDHDKNLMRRPLMLLADASAYVDEYPFYESGLHRAMINLRRAEVSLVSVHAVSWFAAFRTSIFNYGREKDSRKRLLEPKPQWNQAKLNKLKKPLRDNGFTEDDLDRTVSLLYDALAWLDRAEADLQRHPKSRWWWWIYCVLKTRLGEYFQVLRLARLLQSDAPRLSPLIPNRIVSYQRSEVFSDVDTRFIRDPLRLARLLASLEGSVLAELLYSQIRAVKESKPQTGIMRPKEDIVRRHGRDIQRLREASKRMQKLAEQARLSVRDAAEDRLEHYVISCCERVEALDAAMNSKPSPYTHRFSGSRKRAPSNS
ncbi:MAG: hypothetical protein P4L00_14150 [Candidatus Acidoferrales bacterium]|nr:hypothetical protein [Candidatus Acidoferrales bacterium]